LGDDVERGDNALTFFGVTILVFTVIGEFASAESGSFLGILFAFLDIYIEFVKQTAFELSAFSF
jgi:energy-converting hydrogenase Eha subunit A